MRRPSGLRLLLPLLALILTACFRGMPSKKPPIHLNPNMDTQEKYKPQSRSLFFADEATMRPPVEGTVARGHLKNDLPYYTGRNPDSSYVTANPLPLTADILDRGQERFNIYCSPCHSRLGDGKGIITQYKFPIPPTSLHEERIRTMPDGQIFETISRGIRNMPSYRHQIPVRDRWAIIHYVRALQRSQHATLSDIPEAERGALQP
ncbi:MAG: cytochrome c [Candidatus Neomarinimicrobiota bacterium]|nr:MAG: cytochrome c [Candidatus Neomarinimicrobiota bacterium]